MAPALQTRLLQADEAGIAEAADLLRRGALVSFPTETVYGLGGDAGNDLAVAGIYEAKGRPRFNPLIAHVPDLAGVERIAVLTDEARTLAEAFWPGPLTLVLEARPEAGMSALVSAGLSTVAVRVPAHPVAQRLLRAVDRPIVAPSANPSGRISPTTAAHVMAGLSGRIAAVLDGGPCGVGVESTIVGFAPRPTVPRPVVLRPGGLSVEDIEAALGAPLATRDEGARITAPGQLASHYAPDAPVRLGAETARPGERLLGFGDVEADWNLSPRGDLVEAAANLFRMMHEMDRDGTAPIAVSPIPDEGLGRAINDRLRRAAAPR
ncbi:L-threonylcarbamoyladenylate synthase [Maritimibacter sp. DP1N21-5]|uniref:L-threonylcarbamoyladenylate synthase n=1 Tax=Maritimibacter sp. DP1N21-5 TaxID=2836867 RepID=UPI001C43D3CF|nr:L-threonylcarbamoyladenylate synthase [Maritimibacter sp. DP1N21-5]MBV7407862.1 threonylcarbamoyl-AMP synthase [Maritimibacter sp. DP1N21-5]